MRLLKFILLKVVEVGAVAGLCWLFSKTTVAFWMQAGEMLGIFMATCLSVLVLWHPVSWWLKANWRLAGKKWGKR